jgi:KaiC/GvpD/RAD55 family RecA-like ATPase
MAEYTSVADDMVRPFPRERRTGQTAKERFRTFSLGEFVAMPIPAREYVLSPIIPAQGLAMLYAQRGVGKTHVGMGMAYAVATGGPFLRWEAPMPRKVLYVDGEMPGAALQERVKALSHLPRSNSERDGAALAKENLRLLPMDLQEIGASLNLAEAKDQEGVEGLLGDAELLVLDNLSTLVNGGRENDAESWNAMQGWLLRLRRKGISVLLVHHAGRGENARGTSKREDVLDTVIHLKRPDNYEVEEGARFEVHMTKLRGVHGDAARPFEARLSELSDGTPAWSTKDLRDAEADSVLELTKAETTVRDIAEELGISKSKVSRIQQRLRDEGRL